MENICGATFVFDHEGEPDLLTLATPCSVPALPSYGEPASWVSSCVSPSGAVTANVPPVTGTTM
jgi:hypothetical protein